MVAATLPPRARTSTRTFYVAMSLAAAIIAIVGFSQRYFVPLAAGTFEAPAIVHVHGLITFAWVAFLVLQTSLVATGNTSLHRSVGMAGIALGTLLVYTAAQVAIIKLARELSAGAPPLPREFFAAPMSLVVLATGLFGFAIANVHRPETHKRLMLMATFVILLPAFSRILQMLEIAPNRVIRSDYAALATDAMILIAILYDVRTRGRPHPAYLIGGAFIVLVQIGKMAIRDTPAWHGFADWLAGLAG